MVDSEWSQGYVTDASYPHTFFRELSPVWLNYSAALNGVAPRNLDDPFTYLELGCGFGNSTVVHAGACPRGTFHACDFNPVHIAGGQRHAAALDIGNIEFHQASFQQLRSRDLPSFDFIALHGVYSWVAPDARRAIRDLIRERLKPGGLVYLSYNCLPGWAVEVPLRKLLFELAATEGSTAQRTQDAVRSLKQLSNSKLRYFNANPSAAEAVDSYTRGESNYVAHEFLNQAWEPFYSVDVTDEMINAGVSYVGSATLVDNHPALVLDALAAEGVSRLRTARQQQLAIDFAVNQRFRRDIFVRGESRLTPEETMRHVNAAAIGRVGDPERIGTRAKVPRGEITFQDDFIRDLRALMHRGSITIGDAVASLGGGRRGAQEIIRNLTFLVAAAELMPFAKPCPSKAGTVEKIAGRILERVLADVMKQQAPRAVPSEILGNGIQIEPSDAATITKWLAGGDEKVTSGPLLTLIRLGLIR